MPILEPDHNIAGVNRSSTTPCAKVSEQNRPEVMSKAVANLPSDRDASHASAGETESRATISLLPWRNRLRSSAPGLKRADLKAYPYVLGESILPLQAQNEATLTSEDRKASRARIQNLQRACRELNGTVLPSGLILSFWRQIGKLRRRRGYRMADEFPGDREALQLDVASTLGGGLIHLASALSRAAQDAGLMSLEHHPLGNGRTLVRWGEFDLRLAAPEVVSGGPSVLFEARLTPSELIVRVRGLKPKFPHTIQTRPRREMVPTVNESLTSKSSGNLDPHTKTAALLGEVLPEFESYLGGELIDLLMVPSLSRRHRWKVSGGVRRKYAWREGLRSLFKRTPSRFESSGTFNEHTFARNERIAREFAKRLPGDVEHVIVLQDYLPFLWQDGVLEGRSFDVLLTRPPLSFLQEKLDRTLTSRTHSVSSFRAPQDLVRGESEALFFAERAITPHAEYAKVYPHLRKLEWQRPQAEPSADVRRPKYILFPSSLTSLSGGSAALAAAAELGLTLLVVGSDADGLAEGFDNVAFTTASAIPWHEIAALVHPTLLESWPRLHLHARSLGLPVIATEACGLEEGEGVTLVPFGNEDELIRTVARAIMRDKDLGIDSKVRRKMIEASKPAAENPAHS